MQNKLFENSSVAEPYGGPSLYKIWVFLVVHASLMAAAVKAYFVGSTEKAFITFCLKSVVFQYSFDQ